MSRWVESRRVDLFAHGPDVGVPPAPVLVRLEVGQEGAGLGVPGHESRGGRADHGGLGALGQDGAGYRGRAGFGGGDDLGVPGAAGAAQGSGEGGEAVVNQVRRAFDAAHLREGEDVRHARADARIQGSPEVHVAVGAQECEADACL